jgi:hypothetical protein
MIRGAKGWFLGPTALLLLASGCAPLSRSESVTFLSGVCYELPEGGNWEAYVRGAVYHRSWLNRIEPDLIDWLEAHDPKTDPAELATLEKRISPFLDDHVKGKVVSLVVNCQPQALEPSDASGRIRSRVSLAPEQIAWLNSQSTEPDWITLPVRTASWDHRQFVCRALVLHKEGLSVVSDIDDTIKITDVLNTKLMLKNQFCLPFRAVPGMAEVYAAWAKEKKAAFHYLSESPIELEPPLSEFLPAAGYPAGTLDLREIQWGRSRLKGYLALAEAPPEFKIAAMDRLMTALPERRYVLVGDSEQHDPEDYAAVARQHPAQVVRILIRNLTCQDRDCPRYRETFRGLPPELWQLFTDPAEIKDAIPPAGLTTGSSRRAGIATPPATHPAVMPGGAAPSACPREDAALAWSVPGEAG